MASSQDFAEFVLEQIADTGFTRYRKMFGEYMVYVNDKPLLLICDDTVYIKMREEIAAQMEGAETAALYDGAKPYYVLDIEDRELAREVVQILEPITPLPKRKK